MKTHHSIVVKNQTYDYFLKSILIEGEKAFWVECPGAGIDQEFLASDMSEFLTDLPQWISEYQQEQKQQRNTQILLRVKPAEKALIEQKAREQGYRSVSGYLRDKALA